MVNFGGLHSHFQSVKMPQIFAAANFGSLHAIYRGSVSRNCLHMGELHYFCTCPVRNGQFLDFAIMMLFDVEKVLNDVNFQKK